MVSWTEAPGTISLTAASCRHGDRLVSEHVNNKDMEKVEEPTTAPEFIRTGRTSPAPTTFTLSCARVCEHT